MELGASAAKLWEIEIIMSSLRPEPAHVIQDILLLETQRSFLIKSFFGHLQKVLK